MAIQSKLNYDNMKNIQCHEVYHLWSRSCIYGSLAIGGRSFRNSALFFYGPIYLLQLWLQRDKFTQLRLKQHGRAYLQSCSFATLFSMGFIQASCFLRNLLGRYYFYTIAFIPGFICGLSILLEHESRRSIVIANHFNMILQYAMSLLSKYNLTIKTRRGFKTALFMLLSGCLMYLLTNPETTIKPPLLWFYSPVPIRKPEGEKMTGVQYLSTSSCKNTCLHKGPCFRNIITCAGKYFGGGVCIQVLRTILPPLFKGLPMPKMTFLRKTRMYSLGIFAGGYVGIYEAVNCLQNYYRGRNSEVHAIFAGFLAGSAFLLGGNSMFILNAISTILQILVTYGAAKKIIPYSTLLAGLLFALCNAILSHSMITDNKLTPNFFLSLLSLVSGGYSDVILQTGLKVLYEVPQ